MMAIFNRTYACWIKGNRIGTEQRITGVAGRYAAIRTYANRMGLKSFECDGVWVKEKKDQ